MEKTSSATLGKGGAYVYIETAASLVLGYLFWFVMAKISPPEVIGVSATVISMTTIFTSVVTIGIPNGVQRFLGKSFSEQKLEQAKIYVKAAFIMVFAGIVVLSIGILVEQVWIDKTFGISSSLTLAAILIIASSAMNTLFRLVVISTLKTKMLPIVMLISASFKIILAAMLIFLGIGALGLLIGFAINQVLASVIFGFYIMAILKSKTNRPEITLKSSSKNIISASLANWLPTLVTTIGTQLGTVIVFGSQGASQAGIFFIAFSIFSAITGIMFSLFTIAYPALSAMGDGRKRLTWRITRLSLVISLPFSAWLMFYAKDLLQLFSQSYGDGASTLAILLASMLPVGVLTGINTLVYSYGKYLQVLVLGFVSSVPRTALYFVLVPLYGGWGAGLGYTLGSIAGFIASVIIAKNVGMKIVWKELAVLLFIPIAISLPLNYVHVNYIASFLIIPLATWIILLKTGIITQTDLHDSLGILPKSVSNRTLTMLECIRKRLNQT